MEAKKERTEFVFREQALAEIPGHYVKPPCELLTEPAPAMEQEPSDSSPPVVDFRGHALAGEPQQLQGALLARGGEPMPAADAGAVVGEREVGRGEFPQGGALPVVIPAAENSAQVGVIADEQVRSSTGELVAVKPVFTVIVRDQIQVSSGTGTPNDLHKKEQKWVLNYCLKTLLYVVTISAVSSSASYSITKLFFIITLAIYFIVDEALFIMFIVDEALFRMMPVKWGPAFSSPKKWGPKLVYLSCLLQVLLSCILLLSFIKVGYGYAILLVPLAIIVVDLVRHKWQLGGRQRSTNDGEARDVVKMEAGVQGTGTTNEADEDDQRFDVISDLSAGTITCGALIAFLAYHHMVGQVNAVVRIFFFFAIVLGLYLMKATKERTATNLTYGTCLAILLRVLVKATVFTAVIYGVKISITSDGLAAAGGN